MKYDDKRNKLRKLTESDFRKQVLIPLLRAMGYSDVHEFHGPIEKGKDILFREPNKFGESFIHTIIASVEDITGNVRDAKSATTILNQAEMVFNESYKNKYTGRESNVDRCWVITTGTISPQAIESISGKLEKYNLNRFIRFIDIEKLIELIDYNYPQFWERNTQYVFFSRYEEIDISTNNLDPPYERVVDDLKAAGNLKDSVFQIKKLIQNLLYDFDYDIRAKMLEILKTNNPRGVLSIWEDLYDDLGRSGYSSSVVSEIQDAWQYLFDDLREYEERFNIQGTADTKNIGKK